MNPRKPCRKCLLSELDETEVIRELRDYIAQYPADLRAEESEYARRLAVCQTCEELTDGMCRKCGCFVELRALKKGMDCPAQLWQHPFDKPEQKTYNV